MKMSRTTLTEIRISILADARRFLKCLESNAPVEELAAILADIREKESQLIKYERAMLSPAMWQVLKNRLASKMNREYA